MNDSLPAQSSVLDCLFLVRVGKHGQVGRFRFDGMTRLARGVRVLCRTSRGIELGVCLGPVANAEDSIDVADGKILRSMTSEDELLCGHLQQLGEEAHAACEAWLAKHDCSAVLLEVEPLMDGKTLYFHFLNDVNADVQEKLDQLAAIYEQKARKSKFAQLLEHGCGPGCGTEKAKNGCGSRGGCAVCKVASSCKAS